MHGDKYGNRELYIPLTQEFPNGKKTAFIIFITVTISSIYGRV